MTAENAATTPALRWENLTVDARADCPHPWNSIHLTAGGLRCRACGADFRYDRNPRRVVEIVHHAAHARIDDIERWAGEWFEALGARLAALEDAAGAERGRKDG